MESSYFHTSLIRDEWDCRKSSAQNKGRNVCSIVAIWLGWKVVGWFYGMLLLSAKCSGPLGRRENSTWKAIRRTISRPSDSFWSNGWIFSDLCKKKKQVKAPPIFVRKSCQAYSSAMQWSREEFWKGEILVADIEGLENMDASEIHPRRINAKEVLTPQRKEDFIIPVRDGTAKLSVRDHEFREPTQRREQPVGSEALSGELQGEQEGPQPTETKDDAEAQRDFWSIEGDFIYRHHIEPRVQVCVVCRKKKSLFHWKNIDVTRSTHTNLDVMRETRTNDCWRTLSDSWTGFTKFT